MAPWQKGTRCEWQPASRGPRQVRILRIGDFRLDDELSLVLPYRSLESESDGNHESRESDDQPVDPVLMSQFMHHSCGLCDSSLSGIGSARFMMREKKSNDGVRQPRPSGRLDTDCIRYRSKHCRPPRPLACEGR